MKMNENPFACRKRNRCFVFDREYYFGMKISIYFRAWFLKLQEKFLVDYRLFYARVIAIGK
jgi:hypothetical protein